MTRKYFLIPLLAATLVVACGDSSTGGFPADGGGGTGGSENEAGKGGSSTAGKGGSSSDQ